MKITLTYLNGSRQGQTDEFSLPVIHLGRALESDVKLTDESSVDRVASRHHAEFRREGDNLVIYDMGSRNGTLVNGKKIECAFLSDGDRVELGSGGPAMLIRIILSETEDIDFLKNSRLFDSLDNETLKKVLAAGVLEVFPAESYIFRVDQPCEFLYVIKSGVVEVWRDSDADGELDVVSYLSTGDALSPAIILINNVVHQSAARVPEGAVVLKITRQAFKNLILTIPELALSVCTSLAQQLESTYKKLRTNSYRRLQGNLNFFDLATVIQTMMTARQSGVLTISGLEVGFARSGLWASSDDLVLPTAQIHFLDGNVVYTRCGLLNGEEAFFQLFQIEHRGSFTFQEGQPPQKTNAPLGTIHLPGFNLILEAVRLQDELKVLRDQLADPNTRYVALSSRLNWTEPEYPRAAQLVWDRLQQGASIAGLLGEVPFCDFAIYFVVAKLLETGQVRAF
ncbi:MAG: DUF4388 domain-containing protein [Blastocatellia bacterium]|nr:DUF4388 domain-containing protein [Blastocatellia bacterium]